MQLYNTLTRRKEPFEPAGDPITMYVCGVTPYDAAHLGHAMSAAIFDVLRRYLEWRGRRVRFVYNYTDIDDKLIARAERLGVTVAERAAEQIAAFERDMRDLNVRAADVHPRATEEIPKIQEVIQHLVDSGSAYATASGVYFRVRSKEDYGKLSKRDLEELVAGARVEVGGEKEHPMDFALWKMAKPGEPAWEAPWGEGRPGWHIECSAMALRYLGEQIDLHGGGMDLIFPHHENEIAQSECFTERPPFVRHWMHNAMMQLGDEKMSKSLGNLVTIREALERYGADALRLFILTGHYRSPLRYSEAGLQAAGRGAERLQFAVEAPLPTGDGDPVDEARERFTAAMDDDLGTPQALAVLFDLARDINRARDAGVPAGRALALLRELGGVLGLRFQAPPSSGGQAAPFIDLLVRVREELRATRQFALADRIREELTTLGIALEDGRAGTTWRATETTGTGEEHGQAAPPGNSEKAASDTLAF